MLESILEFLTLKNTIIIGAATTVAELTVILVNFYRQLIKNTTELKAMNKIERSVLWAANPINLFRRI